MCLRSLMIASAFVLAFSGIAGTASAQDEDPARTRIGPAMISATSPSGGNAQELAGELCAQDTQMPRMDVRQTGFQGASARCLLKNVVPAAVANSCCTSGVIRRNL